jgi:predicted transcriptional regulator
MGDFNAEVSYTRLHENVKSNQHRIDELEKREVTIYEMVASVKEIAVEMKNMKEAQDDIKKSQTDMIQQIRDIEKRPTKNWDRLVGALISCAVAYLVATLSN